MEPKGVATNIFPLDGGALRDTNFVNERIHVKWRDFTLALDPRNVRAIRRLASNGLYEAEVATTEGFRFSDIRPEDRQLCLETPVGEACIEWAHVGSVEFRPNPGKSGPPEPPRKVAYTITTISGGELAALSLESEATAPFSKKTVMLQVAKFSVGVDLDAVAGLTRQQESATVTLSDGTSLVGTLTPSKLSGKLLLARVGSNIAFSVPGSQVASIQVHRKLPALRGSKAPVTIRVVDQSGREMVVNSVAAFQERHICGNCFCLGGGCGGFRDREPAELSLDEEGARMKVKWSDLKMVGTSSEGRLSCAKKDGSVLAGTLDFGETSYCECAGETGFVGQTAWGRIFLKLNDLRSVVLE